jgi:flavin-dependent dehydrogenase
MAPTVDVVQAAGRTWDALVVGAGPAGALAARELARRGLAVLLVDQADFPRWKVCGSCLNGRALAVLREVGLETLAPRLGAVPLDSFVLAARCGSARVSLPTGMALSRPSFDLALVQEAVREGAHFLPRTRATPGEVEADHRGVFLSGLDGPAHVNARMVLAADGLGGHFARARTNSGSTETRPQSRLGAGVLADDGPDFFTRGTIYMTCADSGYVGIVRVEDGRLDIAAALDPAAVRRASGPGRAAAAVLGSSGFPPIDGLAELPWRGTPPLTRLAAKLAAHRLFVLGDAAGYIEPFTGEGMAWALASAQAVAPLAAQAVESWHPVMENRWAAIYRRTVRQRQFACRVFAGLLRRPFLTRVLVGILAHAPFVARPVLRHLNEPWPQWSA